MYTQLRTTWGNDMNLWMNQAPNAGSIAQPLDLQPNTLLLCYNCPMKCLNDNYVPKNCVNTSDLQLKEKNCTGNFYNWLIVTATPPPNAIFPEQNKMLIR